MDNIPLTDELENQPLDTQTIDTVKDDLDSLAPDSSNNEPHATPEDIANNEDTESEESEKVEEPEEEKKPEEPTQEEINKKRELGKIAKLERENYIKDEALEVVSK